MPAPSTVAAALGEMITNGSLASHLASTISRIVFGLLGGASVGVLLGLAMGTSPRLRRLIDPVVAALHPIPRLAFFPLLIVLFGIGETSKMAAVSLGAFFDAAQHGGRVRDEPRALSSPELRRQQAADVPVCPAAGEHTTMLTGCGFRRTSRSMGRSVSRWWVAQRARRDVVALVADISHRPAVRNPVVIAAIGIDSRR
jgi:hypothetical protein